MTVLVVGQHPGVLVSSKGGRFGVTPASLPTGGTFPSPLANDEPAGGWVAGDEIAWRLDTVAAGGTVSATDQGDWSRTGAADGTYVSTYTRWVARADGTVDKASFTITDTIGSGSHTSTGAGAGGGAVAAGTATLTPSTGTHGSSGAAAGGGAVAVGAAARLGLHTSSAVAAGAGAIVVGTATRTAAPVSHASSGAAVGGGAVGAGSAARVIAGGYPSPSDVRAGVVFGPSGEFVGTMSSGRTMVNLKTGDVFRIV